MTKERTIGELESPKKLPEALRRGRPRGRKDSASVVAMREIMRMSLSRLGGAEAMVKFYKESAENRRTFWGIAGRMLPLEVTGPGGEALKVELSWIDGRGIDKAQAIDVAVREVAALADLSHTQEAIDPPTHIDIDVAPQRQTD
jgi:hypothetical protein